MNELNMNILCYQGVQEGGEGGKMQVIQLNSDAFEVRFYLRNNNLSFNTFHK